MPLSRPSSINAARRKFVFVGTLGVGGSRSLGLGKRGGVGRCPNRFLGLSLNDRTNLDIPCDLSG